MLIVEKTTIPLFAKEGNYCHLHNSSDGAGSF